MGVLDSDDEDGHVIIEQTNTIAEVVQGEGRDNEERLYSDDESPSTNDDSSDLISGDVFATSTTAAIFHVLIKCFPAFKIIVHSDIIKEIKAYSICSISTVFNYIL